MRFDLALADKPAQSADDRAGALRRRDRFLHHLADACGEQLLVMVQWSAFF